MNNNLRIIIPAAGIGSRLQPHTLTTPKPLLPVAGKPMLAHILDPLIELNPAEVIFVIGHHGGQLVDYIEENYDFNMVFVEQKELLGLGFAIDLAIKDLKSSPILIILSDTITRLDYGKFISSGPNVIGLKEVENPSRFGIAITNNGKITEFEEKPQNPRSNLALIGLYYFSDSAELAKYTGTIVGKDKRTSGEIQLTDALELMAKDCHEFIPYVVDNWYDCGKIETMLETNRLLLADLNGQPEIPGSDIIPPVAIASNADIRNSTIGPNVTICRSASIKNSYIEDSIICENATIENCRLMQSMIGKDSSISDKNGSYNIG